MSTRLINLSLILWLAITLAIGSTEIESLLSLNHSQGCSTPEHSWQRLNDWNDRSKIDPRFLGLTGHNQKLTK